MWLIMHQGVWIKVKATKVGIRFSLWPIYRIPEKSLIHLFFSCSFFGPLISFLNKIFNALNKKNVMEAASIERFCGWFLLTLECHLCRNSLVHLAFKTKHWMFFGFKAFDFPWYTLTYSCWGLDLFSFGEAYQQNVPPLLRVFCCCCGSPWG